MKNLLIDLKESKFTSTLDESVLNDFTWDNRAEEFLNYVIKNID